MASPENAPPDILGAVILREEDMDASKVLSLESGMVDADRGDRLSESGSKVLLGGVVSGGELAKEGMVSGNPKSSEKGTTVEDTTAKASWSSIVSNDNGMTKFEYQVEEIDGKSKVIIPPAVFVDSTPLWEDVILGKFLSNAPPVGKVYSLVNKIWPLGEKGVRVEVYGVDAQTMKFRITHRATRARVLRRSLWNLFGVPMIVSKWCPKDVEETKLRKMSLWVTLKNIPRRLFSGKGISFLASPIGSPKKLHPETMMCASFEEARVLIEVDVGKTLPKQCLFSAKDGTEFVIDYVFPWLGTRCAGCLKWGHSIQNCQTKKDNSSEEKPMPTTEKEESKLAQVEDVVVTGSEPKVSSTVMEGVVSVPVDFPQVKSKGVWVEVKSSKTSPPCTVQPGFDISTPSKFSPLITENADDVRKEVIAEVESVYAENELDHTDDDTEFPSLEKSNELIKKRKKAITRRSEIRSTAGITKQLQESFNHAFEEAGMGPPKH